jgi:hypothetical protein
MATAINRSPATVLRYFTCISLDHSKLSSTLCYSNRHYLRRLRALAARTLDDATAACLLRTFFLAFLTILAIIFTSI